jgi:hypothetical protein
MPLKHVSAGSVQTWGKSEKCPKSTKSFPAALGSIPPEIWEIFLMNSTWAADRTFMLRMTSKTVREAVDKIRPPAVVCLSRSFWDGTAAVKLQFVVRKLILRRGTAAEKVKFVLSKLALMTAWCRITTLELRSCEMKGHGAARLAGMLPQCPALVHLDLRGNNIRDKGAESLAGVLAQCPVLAHLNLSGNEIGARGAESLAGVLARCLALAHLNLSNNYIGDAAAESLSGVLAQCPVLAHLNLSGIHASHVGRERLRASWRGQTSLLFL